MREALVFTRTKHRANRLAEHLVQHGVNAERIHGNRSQAQRTEALAGFKSGKYRVLVATDIAARGIDVEALSHVVNFDVPAVPDDYIHRVGRTGRAELTGDAFTFVAPDEEGDLRAIERAIGTDAAARHAARLRLQGQAPRRLEIPLAQRIAAIRARKAEERARAKANAERRAAAQRAAGDRPRVPAQPRTIVAAEDAPRPRHSSNRRARPPSTLRSLRGSHRPVAHGLERLHDVRVVRAPA